MKSTIISKESQSNGINKIPDMIKYYLKNTDKEVKVGDRITISVPASTPYGDTLCEVSVLVTQESLKQLIKDNLVTEENVLDFNEYKPFIRRIARKNNLTLPEAIQLLDSIKEVSIYAHNALLLEAMAEVFNKYKVPAANCNGIIYAYAPGPFGEDCTRCLGGPVSYPFFYDAEDARKALKLMKPFYEEVRKLGNEKAKRKQED